MNKISKIGLFIFILNFIFMSILILLNQTIPDFISYIFFGALIINFVGVIVNQRKANSYK